MIKNCAHMPFNVYHARLTAADNTTVVTTDAVGAFCVDFNYLTEDWQSLNKTAIFTRDNISIAVPFEGNTCLVPWEVLAADESTCKYFIQFEIGLLGTDADGHRLPTNKVKKRIDKSCYCQAEPPGFPSPDVYTQMRAELKAAEEDIAAAEIGLQNMLAPYYLNLESINSLFSGKRIIKNLVFTSNAAIASLAFQGTTGVKTAVINLPNATGINNLFSGSSVEELIINADNVTNAANFATNCKALRVLNFPNCTKVTGALALAGLTSLEVVTVPEQSVKVALMFPASPNLTLESLTNIINGLADLTGAASKTLTIGNVNVAKLTPELKELAANKNWYIK